MLSFCSVSQVGHVGVRCRRAAAVRLSWRRALMAEHQIGGREEAVGWTRDREHRKLSVCDAGRELAADLLDLGRLLQRCLCSGHAQRSG